MAESVAVGCIIGVECDCVYVVVMRSHDCGLCDCFFFLMIRRPPRSTQSRSSAASDVYKRQGADAL